MSDVLGASSTRKPTTLRENTCFGSLVPQNAAAKGPSIYARNYTFDAAAAAWIGVLFAATVLLLAANIVVSNPRPDSPKDAPALKAAATAV